MLGWMRTSIRSSRSRARRRALLAVPALLALTALAPGCSRPVDQPTVAITADDDGFTPATVHVRRGHPLTLIVTRRSDVTCADSVNFVGGAHVALPLGRPVAIPIATGAARTIRYACPMNMYKGSIVVE